MMTECMQKPTKFAEVFLDWEVFEYNKPFVDSKERFIVYRSGRQAGKTTSAAIKIVHFAFFAPILLDTVKKECNILVVAPTQKQAGEMFSRVSGFIIGNPKLESYVIRNTQTELWVRWLNDGGITKIFIRATGEKGTSLRGYSPHLIVVDEASFVSDEIIKALIPSGLATKARLWLFSTPYVSRGFFYEKCMEARKEGSIWKEFHTSSKNNPLIKSDPVYLTLVESGVKESYMLEIEGEFINIGDTVIPIDLLQESLVNDIKPKGKLRYYFGVDVARSGFDETVIIVMGVDETNTGFVVDMIKEGQSNINALTFRIEGLAETYKPESIYIDESGLGGGLVDNCKARGLPIRPITFSLKSKAEIFKDLRMIFEGKRIKIKYSEIAEQLSMMSIEYTENNLMKIKSDGRDDAATALALVAQAISQADEWHLLEMSPKMREALFG